MEILSIGEKIKRSRIYKGYTLKDVCSDKISISKMSCIENGKIIPEEWVLKLVSEKLDIDIKYLKKDIKEQLEENLKAIRSNTFKSEMEEMYKYNLEYAEEYNYYSMAFDIMHLLFKYYLDIKDVNSCQIWTSKYHNLCIKSDIDGNRLIYYLDVGGYLYMGKEYFQAASYYNNVRKELTSNGSKEYRIIISATYQEAKCYLIMKNYEKAYEIVDKLMEYIEKLDNDDYKAEIYNLVAVLSIKVGNGKFKKYEKYSLELCKNNIREKGIFLYRYGSAMIGMDKNEKAYEYIYEAMNLYPDEDKLDYVNFMIDVIQSLIDIGKLDIARELCDKILNYSIDINNNIFIEKAYYFKAITISSDEKFETVEMYMNLSMDILLKIGTKEQVYKRYLELGNLYFKNGDTNESLKYFSFAINLGKKL